MKRVILPWSESILLNSSENIRRAVRSCLVERADGQLIVDAHHPAYKQVMCHQRQFSGIVGQGMDHVNGKGAGFSSRPGQDLRSKNMVKAGGAAGISLAEVESRTAFQSRALNTSARHAEDDRQARWGRTRHEGFVPKKHIQPAPMLFTADHHPLWLGDTYRGRSAFLICGGPSFGQLDHAKLRQPGILTMGINNAVKTYRPNLWVSVDDPSHFIRSIWLDPTITKFVPICHAGKRIFNSDAWQWTAMQVRDCPAVHYYKRNEHFRPDQFLWEDTFNWGNHKNHGGGRSVMLVAIRLLFYLGIRRVFLLGADFSMNESDRYHFDQDRSKSSVRGNMSTYQKLNGWFSELRPRFEAEGFHVFNCNGQSHLKAFDHVAYEDAIGFVLDEWGNINLVNERTAGLYDQEKPKA